MDDSYSISNSTQMSPDIRAFGAAFLKAKDKFRQLEKTGRNQKWDYAKLEDIYNTIEKALSENDIVIWHFRSCTNDQEYLHTRLTHIISGQYIEDASILKSEKPGNQGQGSSCTYMKRYALLNLCALGGDPQDDDGISEERYIEQRVNYITVDQVKNLEYMIKSSSNAVVLYNKILSSFKINQLSYIPVSRYEEVVIFIECSKNDKDLKS